MNKKTLYKTLGTSVINRPMSKYFLIMITFCYLKKNVDFVSPPSILFRHLCNFSLIYVPQSNLSVPENLSIFSPLTSYHYWLNFILQNEYFYNILLRKPYPGTRLQNYQFGPSETIDIFCFENLEHPHTPFQEERGQLAFYCTSPQSFIIIFSYLFA